MIKPPRSPKNIGKRYHALLGFFLTMLVLFSIMHNNISQVFNDIGLISKLSELNITKFMTQTLNTTIQKKWKISKMKPIVKYY